MEAKNMQVNNRARYKAFCGILPALCILIVGLLAAPASAGKLFDKIKERGEIVCGVSTGLAGYSLPGSDGRWTGFDVDYCRALAAALFSDPDKVRFVPLSSQQRFTALQSGEVDVLSRNTTWTLSRDAGQGINFTTPLLYGGQGFMVPTRHKLKHIDELEGATICIQGGTTNELNVADYFRSKNLDIETVVFEDFQESVSAFFTGRCDAYTEDVVMLPVIRKNNTATPEKYEVLSQTISKEPLGPSVPQGDSAWFNLARWTAFALIEAEELGLNSKNVEEEAKTTRHPAKARLLGKNPGLGKMLGVEEDWVVQIIQHVGNYGEVFDRNLTPLGIDRETANFGYNQLFKDGGLLYAPPFK